MSHLRMRKASLKYESSCFWKSSMPHFVGPLSFGKYLFYFQPLSATAHITCLEVLLTERSPPSETSVGPWSVAKFFLQLHRGPYVRPQVPNTQERIALQQQSTNESVSPGSFQNAHPWDVSASFEAGLTLQPQFRSLFVFVYVCAYAYM